MHNYILPFNSIYYVIFSCLITIWRWHRDSILLWRHYTHYVHFSRNQILWSEFWANFAADDVTFPSSEKTEKFVVCNTNHGALNALHLVMRVWLRWDERDLHFTRYGGVIFFKCTGHTTVPAAEIFFQISGLHRSLIIMIRKIVTNQLVIVFIFAK